MRRRALRSAVYSVRCGAGGRAWSASRVPAALRWFTCCTWAPRATGSLPLCLGASLVPLSLQAERGSNALARAGREQSTGRRDQARAAPRAGTRGRGVSPGRAARAASAGSGRPPARPPKHDDARRLPSCEYRCPAATIAAQLQLSLPSCNYRCHATQYRGQRSCVAWPLPGSQYRVASTALPGMHVEMTTTVWISSRAWDRGSGLLAPPTLCGGGARASRSARAGRRSGARWRGTPGRGPRGGGRAAAGRGRPCRARAGPPLRGSTAEGCLVFSV
jgi:hypothetical protein